jgi:hypothetical protein
LNSRNCIAVLSLWLTVWLRALPQFLIAKRTILKFVGFCVPLRLGLNPSSALLSYRSPPSLSLSIVQTCGDYKLELCFDLLVNGGFLRWLFMSQYKCPVPLLRRCQGDLSQSHLIYPITSDPFLPAPNPSLKKMIQETVA